MSCGIELGSVWRERDNRFERYVRVVCVPLGGTKPRVGIQTINADDGRSVKPRTTFAALSAFGKRYQLVPTP